jgi:hypothetical protein
MPLSTWPRISPPLWSAEQILKYQCPDIRSAASVTVRVAAALDWPCQIAANWDCTSAFWVIDAGP